MIEDAYTCGAALGLAVWREDEAGPFQAVPHPGPSWQPGGRPSRQPHEYVRGGTAKVLTLFRPADGRVRVEGATTCPNAVLHPWLKRELTAVPAELPAPPPAADSSRAAWERRQVGLTEPITLPAELPPLRVLRVRDNLAGHRTPAFVLRLLAHGVMPLYTPLSGSRLNMAESTQRALKRRALDGQHPTSPAEIMARSAAVARHWNAALTPFVWGGRRASRRMRERERRHTVGGSGVFTRQPIRRRYGHVRGSWPTRAPPVSIDPCEMREGGQSLSTPAAASAISIAHPVSPAVRRLISPWFRDVLFSECSLV